VQLKVLKAKNRLSALIKAAQAGEDVIIADRGAGGPARAGQDTGRRANGSWESPIHSRLARKPRAPELCAAFGAGDRRRDRGRAARVGLIYVDAYLVIYLAERHPAGQAGGQSP
jgi:hypothetical protein